MVQGVVMRLRPRTDYPTVGAYLLAAKKIYKKMQISRCDLSP